MILVSEATYLVTSDNVVFEVGKALTAPVYVFFAAKDKQFRAITEQFKFKSTTEIIAKQCLVVNGHASAKKQ